MAVTLLYYHQKGEQIYTCLASDNIEATDLGQIGAIFLEKDTGRVFKRTRNDAGGLSLISDRGYDFVGFEPSAYDAFGRIRVSNPETIFDSKQLYDKQPLFWDEAVTGTGSVGTHNPDTASTVMDVDAATAGSTTRQTFMRFNYQPGKSQLIFMTGTLKASGASGAGLVRGFGYGDDDNGLFLVDDEGTVKLRKRSYTSGAAVDTDVAQANWNIDPMDGDGISGITVDWTKSQILVIDFEWLGVGKIRIALNINGRIYYLHEWNHANVLAGVYMSTPNLPLRYWIDNDGTYASAATIEHICSSVMSEGGAQDNGILRYASTNNTQVDCAVVGTLYLIKGIRLKSTHLSATVKMLSAALQIQSASDDIEWRLVFDPTYSAAPTWNNETNSAVQTCTGTGETVTNGYTITGGYLASGTGGSASASIEREIENALLLGASIAGTAQTIALCAMPLTNVNTLVEGSLTWREVS